MSTVSSITGTSNQNASAESVIPAKTLNQEDFFKLLITQLTSQDPMKPLSNAEFMGQMAQFSSLEQTRSMDATISSLRNDQQMLQANSLIGRDVNLKLDSGVVQGTVTSVQIDEGTPKIVVNGAAYDLSTVLTISPAANTL
ncbi:MAG: flagellar hook capping protein [Akkermansiaceae bacterium]|nr:flagellar hook capping protein [Verrucomicrobiales bacterium]